MQANRGPLYGAPGVVVSYRTHGDGQAVRVENQGGWQQYVYLSHDHLIPTAIVQQVVPEVRHDFNLPHQLSAHAELHKTGRQAGRECRVWPGGRRGKASGGVITAKPTDKGAGICRREVRSEKQRFCEAWLAGGQVEPGRGRQGRH